MTKHVEHEHQVTELTADEMERVAGGFMTITLTEAMISSYSMSGGSQPVPSDECEQAQALVLVRAGHRVPEKLRTAESCASMQPHSLHHGLTVPRNPATSTPA